MLFLRIFDVAGNKFDSDIGKWKKNNTDNITTD